MFLLKYRANFTRIQQYSIQHRNSFTSSLQQVQLNGDNENSWMLSRPLPERTAAVFVAQYLTNENASKHSLITGVPLSTFIQKMPSSTRDAIFKENIDVSTWIHKTALLEITYLEQDNKMAPSVEHSTIWRSESGYGDESVRRYGALEYVRLKVNPKDVLLTFTEDDSESVAPTHTETTAATEEIRALSHILETNEGQRNSRWYLLNEALLLAKPSLSDIKKLVQSAHAKSFLWVNANEWVIASRHPSEQICPVVSLPEQPKARKAVALNNYGGWGSLLAVPTKEDVYEILRYVPINWGNFGSLNIPPEKKKKHIRCSSTMLWFRRQPHYFELRNMNGTVEIRRSVILHPDCHKMTPEQAKDFVEHGISTGTINNLMMVGPDGQPIQHQSPNEKHVQKFFYRVCPPYFVPFSLILQRCTKKNVTLRELQDIAIEHPEDFEIVSAVGLEVPFQCIVGGFEEMTNIINRHPQLFRVGERFFCRVDSSDPLFNEQSEPHESEMTSRTYQREENPYLSTKELAKIFHFIASADEPCNASFFVRGSSPAMRVALPPRITSVLQEYPRLFACKETSPGVFSIRKLCSSSKSVSHGKLSSIEEDSSWISFEHSNSSELGSRTEIIDAVKQLIPSDGVEYEKLLLWASLQVQRAINNHYGSLLKMLEIEISHFVITKKEKSMMVSKKNEEPINSSELYLTFSQKYFIMLKFSYASTLHTYVSRITHRIQRNIFVLSLPYLPSPYFLSSSIFSLCVVCGFRMEHNFILSHIYPQDLPLFHARLKHSHSIYDNLARKFLANNRGNMRRYYLCRDITWRRFQGRQGLFKGLKLEGGGGEVCLALILSGSPGECLNQDIAKPCARNAAGHRFRSSGMVRPLLFDGGLSWGRPQWRPSRCPPLSPGRAALAPAPNLTFGRGPLATPPASPRRGHVRFQSIRKGIPTIYGALDAVYLTDFFCSSFQLDLQTSFISHSLIILKRYEYDSFIFYFVSRYTFRLLLFQIFCFLQEFDVSLVVDTILFLLIMSTRRKNNNSSNHNNK
eukprot:gene8543-5990_t